MLTIRTWAGSIAVAGGVLFGNVNAAEEHWIKVGETANGQYVSYVDTSSVTTGGQGTVVAWLKRIYAAPVRDGFFSRSYVSDLRRAIFRCAEPAVALVEHIRLDESQNTVKQERWPESQWRFDGLPSGSVAHTEARAVCGLAVLPTSRVSSRVEGDWRQLSPGNNAIGVDHSWVPGADGLFVARTRHYLENVQTFSGKPYSVAINYWVVLCGRPGVGLYAFANRNLAGDLVESLVVVPERVEFWKPGGTEKRPVEEFLFSALCKIATAGAPPVATGISPTPTPPATGQQNAPERKDPKVSASAGSGFYVSRDGHILTNSHVVSNCNQFRGQILVRHPDRTVAAAQKVAEDRVNDLALLRVDRQPAELAIFRQTPAEPGEPVMAIGFPEGANVLSDAIVSTGIINAAVGRSDVSLLQFSAPVQPGNSGGPVLEKGGAVIGVASARLEEMPSGRQAQNVNFAIKGDVAKIFLDSYGVKYATTAPGRGLDPTAIASIGKGFTVFVACVP